MKKIIVLSFLFTIAFMCSFAQQSINAVAVPMYSLDSTLVSPHVSNTGSVILKLAVPSSWDCMSIQFVETKVSGTIAGTAVLVGSNDGINYVTISRPSIAVTALRPAYTDTLTSTNVTTNTKIWTLSNSAAVDGQTCVSPPYLYYGIKKTGSGTMNSTIKGYIVPRHK